MKAIMNKVLTPMGFEANQIYGLIDFLIGFFMIVMPWFYANERNILFQSIIMVIGSTLVLYSIFTDYRQGFIKRALQIMQKALNTTLGIPVMLLSITHKTALSASILLLLALICLLGLQ